jgi:hypothetical protein
MRIAQSTFVIGGHEFEVPQIHPVVLEEIREFARTIDMALPHVQRIVALAAIAAMLTPAYPWVTPKWLNENISAEAIAGFMANLGAQIDLASAARTAPAQAADAQAGLLH